MKQVAESSELLPAPRKLLPTKSMQEAGMQALGPRLRYGWKQVLRCEPPPMGPAARESGEWK